MAKIKQPELPFKDPYKPFFKTQSYMLEVKFRSTGIVLAKDVKLGMLIAKGDFSHVQQVEKIEEKGGRIYITKGSKYRDITIIADMDDEYHQMEIVHQDSLEL